MTLLVTHTIYVASIDRIIVN